MSRERFYDERDAVKTITQHGNTVQSKKIHLKAKRLAAGEMPGATSAGLKLWSAIDYLTGKGYGIVYEVAGEKKKK